MIAQSIVRQRDARSRVFGDLREPAWLMLIGLLIAERAGRVSTIGDLCVDSRAPQTTGLRHIDILTSRGLIERVPNRKDERIVHVRLTEKAHESLDAWARDCGEML
jgi:DNA-binding MarR family transcriptional regulator